MSGADVTGLSDEVLTCRVAQAQADVAAAREQVKAAQQQLDAARAVFEPLLEESASRRLTRSGGELGTLIDVAVVGAVPYGPAFRQASQLLRSWVAAAAPSGVTRDWAHMSVDGGPLVHTPQLTVPHGSVADPAMAAAEFLAVLTEWDAVLGYPDEVPLSVMENSLSEHGVYGVRFFRSSGRAEVVFTRYSRQQTLFSGSFEETVGYLAEHAWYGPPEREPAVDW